LVCLIVLAVLISLFDVVARGMYLRIVLLIEREVLNRLHYVPLPHVNHGLNVVDEALMLNQSCILNSLLDLNWVLTDLSPQLCGHFDLNVSLGDVILENQEHCLVTLKENFVLMRIEVLGGHSVLAHVCRIDNAETVLDQDGLIQSVERVDIRLRLRLLALL
jgi:hypothetical protein